MSDVDPTPLLWRKPAADRTALVARKPGQPHFGSALREHVGELLVAAGACPAERAAPVQPVEDERVCSELEQRDNRLAPACLGREVDGGDALAVARPAKRAALIDV